jgi:hypothetical protein
MLIIGSRVDLPAEAEMAIVAGLGEKFPPGVICGPGGALFVVYL